MSELPVPSDDTPVVGSRACPACGAGEVRSTYSVTEAMFGTGDRFHYDECARCGTLRLVSPPTDVSAYYPAHYYSVARDPERTVGRAVARPLVRLLVRSALRTDGVASWPARVVGRVEPLGHHLRNLSSIARARPDVLECRVLDVGSGSGTLVYALSLAGCRAAAGVDPHATSDRVFQTGGRVVRGSVADVGGLWDLVMFHHSLEHVTDPHAALVAARDALATGGCVLVRAPTVSSAAWERYGVDWVQIDAPRHHMLPSRAGMSRLAHLAGFRVEWLEDDSTAFQFWGSEQVRAGVPLFGDPRSRLATHRAAPFPRRQTAAWKHAARRLNAHGRGDQAIWCLVPA